MSQKEGFQILANELNTWTETGKIAEIWWRDDDLKTSTKKLDHLLSTANDIKLVPLLAVVPAKASRQLMNTLNSCNVKIAMHGFQHQNHEALPKKKSEFGDSRLIEHQKIDLKNGIKQLDNLFGKLFLKCFVPPWNRANNEVIKCLPSIGISGISTFAPRKKATPAPGLTQVNTHVDIIDWKGTRKFIGAGFMATQIAFHLKKMRVNLVDNLEPMGILSHHLEMSDMDWQDFKKVFLLLKANPSIKLNDPINYFG